jgi:hypothetical protein
MKDFKIIILVLLFVNGVNAQQKQHKDFEYYNTQIDSIVLYCSTDFHEFPKNFFLSFSDAELNENDRLMILQKISKMFEQKKYTNLYVFGHYLINRIWEIYPEQNTVKVNQLLIELYLKYYFYPSKNIDDA